MAIRSTRRDTRHPLRRGSSFVESTMPLAASGEARAVLTRVSVSSFAFEVDGIHPELEVGTRLAAVTVCVGDCTLHGDAVVRSTAKAGDRSEIGCLFYPESPSGEERWMALISGIEATEGA